MHTVMIPYQTVPQHSLLFLSVLLTSFYAVLFLLYTSLFLLNPSPWRKKLSINKTLVIFTAEKGTSV